MLKLPLTFTRKENPHSPFVATQNPLCSDQVNIQIVQDQSNSRERYVIPCTIEKLKQNIASGIWVHIGDPAIIETVHSTTPLEEPVLSHKTKSLK